MTFAQRRNHLTTHFSELIPVVKRRMTISQVEVAWLLFLCVVLMYVAPGFLPKDRTFVLVCELESVRKHANV